jgi:hypothetical protein
MLRITWDDEEAKPVVDRLVNDEAKRIVDDYLKFGHQNDCKINEPRIAQEMIVDALRVLVKQKYIIHEDIVLVIDGREIRFDEKGNLESYVYPSVWTDNLFKLLEI